MSEIDVFIAGRAYKVACRDGEEDALRKAAALVDTKSREALDGGKGTTTAPPPVDPALAERAERIADRLESLAVALETEASSA